MLTAVLDKVGLNTQSETATDHQIKLVAAALGISVKEAMAALLHHQIWPERFSRNRGIFTAEQQVRLMELRVFMAGSGGLGGHMACMLARMGLGTLKICDPDVFEESNLNRQRFCTEKTIGQSKAAATRRGLLEIASYMDIEANEIAVNSENLDSLLAGMDIAVDCLDSVPRKKMLEIAASNAAVAYLHGSVLEQDGFIYLDMPGKIRMQALYPDIAAGGHSIGVNNVLASTVTAAAALMASLLVNGLILRNFSSSPLLHLDCSVPWLELFEE